jgi:hypothetical protein
VRDFVFARKKDTAPTTLITVGRVGSKRIIGRE